MKIFYQKHKKEENMKINKDTKIGELLEKAPEKAEILLEAGMHCLGCPASQMETIEEACQVHGIDVEEIVKQLNNEENAEQRRKITYFNQKKRKKYKKGKFC